MNSFVSSNCYSLLVLLCFLPAIKSSLPSNVTIGKCSGFHILVVCFAVVFEELYHSPQRSSKGNPFCSSITTTGRSRKPPAFGRDWKHSSHMRVS
jgi:hypothetical protein